MLIDRSQLYEDILIWLPESNSLSEAQMKAIIGMIIAQVGDDADRYAEVLCLALKAIGTANMAKVSAVSDGLRREKAGGEEYEYALDGSAQAGWKAFVDSLKDICPLFGYYGLRSNVGIKINTSLTPNVNPKCCPEIRDRLGYSKCR